VTFLGDAPKAEKEIFKGATPIIYRKPEAKGWSRTWCARLVNRMTLQDGTKINTTDGIVGEVDFDDPGTRKKIVADAIYKNQSEQRVSQGEERLHLRNHQMPYSGWWKERRGKGNGYNFAALVQYKEGKKHGPMARWYKNGKKQVRTTYKDGKKHGSSIEWYDNGRKKFENTYKDGKLWTAVVWKRNGEQCPATNLVNGNGDWVYYNPDGTEERREIYREGVLVPD
jgi:antitoxin component YwqK of YwqJK toxin-antitoxin module